MQKAFVLGNGKSRLDIDLNKLRKFGKIYGCNALYRDFAPDVLVATDRPISDEIQRSGYAKKNVFYTRLPQKDSGAKKIELNYGYSSGPIAISYALHHGATEVVMIGFDFSGTKGLFNNVYENTKFYKKSSDKETFYGNWVNQCVTIMNQNLHKKFVRIIKPGILIPKEFKHIKNLVHVDMAEFLKTINI